MSKQSTPGSVVPLAMFVFFLTKTVKIRWNWRCKIFSLNIRGVKFWTNFMSGLNCLGVKTYFNRKQINREKHTKEKWNICYVQMPHPPAILCSDQVTKLNWSTVAMLRNSIWFICHLSIEFVNRKWEKWRTSWCLFSLALY